MKGAEVFTTSGRQCAVGAASGLASGLCCVAAGRETAKALAVMTELLRGSSSNICVYHIADRAVV